MQKYKRAAAAVGTTAAIGFGVLFGLFQTQSSLARYAERSMRERLALSDLAGNVGRAGAANKAYILTNDQTWMVAQRKSVDLAWRSYGGALNLASDQKQVERLYEIRKLMLVRFANFDRFVADWRVGIHELPVDQALIALGRLIDEINLAEDANIEWRDRVVDATYGVFGVVIIVFSVSLLLFIHMGYKRIRDDHLYEQQLLDNQKLLVRELNHRVKNSLQTVSSVLRLQLAKLGPEEQPAADALRTASMRINAVGKVHEQLYEIQSKKLPANDFITKLLDDLQKTAPVEIYHKVEPVALNIDHAVPLSLLLNELLTNAIKYGHDDKTQAVVELSLGPASGREDTHWQLTVRDHGPGFPLGFDPKRVKSLGYKVVLGLTQQLGAVNISFTNEPGATFKMEAPLNYTA
jgi:two-component sensor histidine kinase